ncbi:S53 family peptidase [Amycolatopsis anabasis]|uniref:S53 family peptidase n=1 Tax=Amycolatopsis anabasis TaxID=1840409 RepID=UPI00131CDF77|nr:S53 family serine peptidase [Amycolatopsis anabasis]
MPLRPWRTTAVASGLAVAAAVTAFPASAQPSGGDQDDRTVVAGSTPSWATSQAKTGDVADDAVRHVQIALSLRDQAGAERLAAAVATPGTAEHGKFLTPQQFVERFAASDETVTHVRDWLTQQGLAVTGVSANRHFIDAQAPTGVLEKAFGTQLSTFRSQVSGRVQDLVAPASPISLPRELRGAVTTVLGLDDSAKAIKPQHTAPSAPGANAVQHCARWWGEQNNAEVPQKYPAGSQSNSLCGYTGPSVRAMYGLNPGHHGAGTTVGIVGAYNSPTLVADTNRAAGHLGVPPLAADQYSAVLPDGGFTDEKECDAEGWYGEQTLDVQASHTIAPNAKIRYYAAKTCIGGLYDAFNKAVQDNAVDVISNSWGDADGERRLPAATRDQFNSMALQAGIQGQSVTVSTGDAGNNSGMVGRITAGFPASSPWVTAVGGTTVGLGQDNKPKVLTGWENTGNTLSGGQWVPQRDADGPFAGGAGGGPSALYDAPDWQAGAVPAEVAHGKRAVPDIAALADSYTGMLVGQTDSRGQFTIGPSGGTSLAAPLVAGLAVDAQQARAGTARAGLLNPALYALKGSPAIIDVTPQKAGVWTPSMHSLPGTSVPGGQGSYLVDFDTRPQNLQSAPGWDTVTGLGTPSAGFVAALAK